MTDYLTINEAAQALGLHPQTVYRKCRRDELPYTRFGRTLRIPADRLGMTKRRPAKSRTVPSFMTRLFWEYDPTRLQSSDSIVIERVLELGDLPEWRWLERHVERFRIRHFLRSLGKKRLSPRNFLFWAKLFGVNHEDRRSAQNPM
jgi:excisionase family DNA binding protein